MKNELDDFEDILREAEHRWVNAYHTPTGDPRTDWVRSDPRFWIYQVTKESHDNPKSHG